MAQWPAQLRQMVLLVVQDPFPAGGCCPTGCYIYFPDLIWLLLEGVKVFLTYGADV